MHTDVEWHVGKGGKAAETAALKRTTELLFEVVNKIVG